MPRLKTKLASLLLLGLLFTGFLTACASKQGIVDTWVSSAPSSMRFEFRPDGTVWLTAGAVTRQVWRYELPGGDALRLYDGMGRKREYRFAVQGDTLTFSDPGTGKTAETYTRWKQ
ncbi:MAG TPA: hypothetical protein VF813_06155 [Anaerolineaceae bacterium]